MKLAAKRGLYALLLLGGLALAGYLIYTTCSRPFLYVDLSAFGMRQGLFLAATVVLWVAMGFALTFTFYHADLPLLRMLLPLLLCLVCLLGGALTFRQGVQGLLCSYTDQPADYRPGEAPTELIATVDAPFDAVAAEGEVIGYVFFQRGQSASEELTVQYDQEAFMQEQRRINTLRLPAVEEGGKMVYITGSDERATRLIVDPKQRTVCYGRYINNDGLPEFAPHLPFATDVQEASEP